jgi:uncharacterized protein YuzE
MPISHANITRRWAVKEPKVTVRFDEEADAIYIQLGNARIIESEEIQPDIIFDFDDQNHVVGIEILSVSKTIPGFDPTLSEFDVA